MTTPKTIQGIKPQMILESSPAFAYRWWFKNVLHKYLAHLDVETSNMVGMSVNMESRHKGLILIL